MKIAAGDRLPEYLLGALPGAEAEDVARALADSPELQAEAEELQLALTQIPAMLAPVVPSSAARARLMAAVGAEDPLAAAVAAPIDGQANARPTGSPRFEPFVDTLARMLDLAADSVRQLLGRVDEPSSWGPGLPGMLFQHFTPGPQLVGVDAGLIRLEAGIAFPRHRHVAGNELTFVLDGCLIDCTDGSQPRSHAPGALVEQPEDSVHGYAASAEGPLTIIVVNHGIQPVFG